MKNILISGANGFLGSHLLSKLIKKSEYTLFTLSRSKETLIQLYNHLEVKCYDIEDLQRKTIPFNEIDVVIHCAFTRSNNGFDLYNSLIHSQTIFEESIRNKCHVINISSRSVYGHNANIPWNENTEPQPIELYAFAKLSSEFVLNCFAHLKPGACISNIRLAGLIGVNFEERILNKFISNAIQAIPISIAGGSQQFAYLDVRDAIDGIIALINTPVQVWKPLYNLGYLRSYSILEIVEVIKRVADNFNCPAVELIHTPSNDTLYAEMDSSLFYNDTGWKPKYDMEAMVRKIFEYKLKGV